MPHNYDADVIVIGAGPVGLAAAIDLNAKGVNTVVIEQRPFGELPEVKSNHVASRTMERFRRLGIAEAVRDAGLPHEHPHDIAFLTTVTGRELARIVLPSRNGRRSEHPVGADVDWPTPEPPHRINQTFLEPLLARHAAALPHVDLRNETRFIDFDQDDDGVTVRTSDLDGSNERSVRGKYLLGADGSRSAIRKAIGATLSGDAVLSHVQSTCIRAPHLYDLILVEKAWCYYTYNPRRNGHVFTIDGTGTFLVHNYMTPEEYAAGAMDRDRAIRTILGVGDDFQYEIISNEDWTARRLVVDKLRERRAFLAGDAAHLWVPYAGFGMNAGIADAVNLTWLLGAVVNGWADERILDAYEAERLPITSQVSHFAMGHQRKVSQAEVPAEIEDDTPAGAAARERIGATAYELNVQQFAAAGLNYGYSYDASPIISYDGQTAPAYSMGAFTPSTVPGCRAPHFWLSDGRSVYDAFGPGYTLLCFGDVARVAGLIGAADAARLPLEVVDARDASGTDDYDCAFVLAREDQHIAWRGNEGPEEPAELVALIRGEGR